MWKQTFTIPLNERAILVRHGLPVRALAPGRHGVWGSGHAVIRLDVNALVLDVAAELRAVLPVDWYAEVKLGGRQRGVHEKNGRPVRYLRPGLHRYRTVDRALDLRVFDIDQQAPELTDELRAS